MIGNLSENDEYKYQKKKKKDIYVTVCHLKKIDRILPAYLYYV